MLSRSLIAVLAITAITLTASFSVRSDSPPSSEALRPAMHMVYTKTILGIRVMDVTILLKPALSDQLRRLSSEQAAMLAQRADESGVELVFLRGAGFGRFFSEVSSSLACARDSGAISPDEYLYLTTQIPKWFGPLKDRGIQKGDHLSYRIRRDRMDTLYKTAAGTVLIDHADQGDLGQRSVLASYFAGCSDFKGPLLGSLQGPAD